MGVGRGRRGRIERRDNRDPVQRWHDWRRRQLLWPLLAAAARAEELLMQEARIDQAARQKIESQRRTIIEGSEEWSILYRKYYNDEVKKLGV